MRLYSIEDREKVIAGLSVDPLAAEARSHRRGTLITSAVVLVLIHLGLVPREISALGVTLEASDRRGVVVALLLLLTYFVVAFVGYAASDFLAWRILRQRADRAHTQGRMFSEEAHGHLERISREYAAGNEEQKAARREELGRQAASTVELEVQRRTLTALRPVSFLRGTMDFALPLALAAFAYEAIIVWLWF